MLGLLLEAVHHYLPLSYFFHFTEEEIVTGKDSDGHFSRYL